MRPATRCCTRPFALIALLGALFVVATGPTASAGTETPLHVTSTADLPDTNPTDGVCHASNGLCTLRGAVQTANNAPGTYFVILLGKGTYTLSLKPASEDAALGGDLDVLQGMGFAGKGAGKTIVRIDRTKVKDRVFQLLTSGVVGFADMSITGGFAPAGDSVGGDGGAVQTAGAEVRLENAVVTGNHASGDGGGLSTGTRSLYLTNSTVSGNTAAGDGGGARATNAIIAAQSTVSGNQANGDGGGLDGTAQVLMNASTVAGNTAGGTGGGIATSDSAELFDVTVAGNGAPAVGNVDTPNLQLKGSILANALQGHDCDATNVTGQHSLVEDPTGCDVLAGFVTGKDPKLGPLQRNGGPTATMALLPGSPGINTGAKVRAAPTDQRGVQRPQGPAVDMGAYEVAIAAVTAPQGTIVHLSTFPLGWQVPGGGAGAAKFDVRYRDHKVGAPHFGSFHAVLDHTPKHHTSFTATFGFEYCFSASAIDAGGNVSPFGPQHCVTVSH